MSPRVVLAAVAAALVLATPAGAQTATTISVVSHPKEFVGDGRPWLFDPGTNPIAVDGTLAEPQVHVRLPQTQFFDFSFRSDGGVLNPGAYPDAAGLWSLAGPRPGIRISAESRGCSEALGNFDVLDFAVRGDGQLERLWIQFDQRCDQLEPRLFGKIRIGMPVPSGPAVTAPALARWPDTDVGRFEPDYPVALIAAHADVAVAGASLTGAHAGDFRIADDQCRGRTVPTGGACFVWVTFEPRSPG